MNVIPGYDGFVTSQDHAVTIANEIGYPVMIKATSGGGGKGMRICHKDTEVKEGFTLSAAEAKSFFNDDRLFIEKYIEKPHHIEFQLVSGRKDGSKDLEILCFPERECSIQRRNQKILEESPSTLLTEETRAEMVRQVKRLVREVDYSSAGTVEFLVDEKQNFYFLEMNTRLQVEHPVTEMVSAGDIDLVHAMIDVAAGKGIPREYMDMLGDQNKLTDLEWEGRSVPFQGHAIEARVYAEDPYRNFLPSTGPLIRYIEPEPISSSDGGDIDVRVDSGVIPGSIISQYYDPMISKLIVHSRTDRFKAIDGLRKALDGYVISGIRHNCNFLSEILRHAAFVRGETPTNFIEMHYPDGFSGVKLSKSQTAELVAIAAKAAFLRESVLQRPPNSLDRTNGVKGIFNETVVCVGGLFGRPFTVRCTEDKFYVACENDEVYPTVDVTSMESEVLDPIINIVIDGNEKIMQIGNEDNTGTFKVTYDGAVFDVIVMSPEEFKLAKHMKEPKKIDTSSMILSPMPGTLISYSVKDGEKVVENQDVCIIEAMKMQNIIRSPRSGVIKKLQVAEGSSLMADELIVEFEKI